MQPPRPYQGVPYDKDMFTFLPALANQDTLVEPPRKRKSYTSDSQITVPAPTMTYGSYGNLNPDENSGVLRGKELQSYVPASSPPKSLTFRKDSDSAKFWNQNDSSTHSHSDERACHEYFSYASQSQSSNYNNSQSLVQSSAGLTHLSPNWSPLVTEYSNQNGSHDSNAHFGGDGNGFHVPVSQSYGLQTPTLTQFVGSTSNELVNAKSQNLQENVSIPGVYTQSSDGKGFNERSYQTDTSSNIGHVDASNFARVEGTKMLGNNVGYFLQNLLEFNSILQQALKLVSASSGTGLTVNQDGSIRGCEGDATAISSTLNLPTQNFSHPSIDGTSSKGGEAGHNLDNSIISGDDGSLNLDDGLKSEFGDSTLTQKLWDGTLQLGSSVSVSAVAFFKSGEWMPDFDWSGSVEVKGKVKVDAFEKYVQDLPRSRSRGLMVMSLLAKEGSSTTDLKNMTEVARKYKEGRRVGIAQLNKGVDMYICPHSDAIITILAKHGFFKGMTAVKEKSDLLLGCVVWRKNSTPASTTETAMIHAPTSGTSLSEQSDGISEKIQNEVVDRNNSLENKSQNVSVTPCIGQPEQTMIPENKSTSISVNNTQISELYSKPETFKPNLPNPPVLNQPAVLCDDEDLPEYDFGSVITQTFESTVAVPFSPTPKSEQYEDSHVRQPIEEKRPESSTVSETLPYLRVQWQPLNMKNQLEAQNSSMQAQQKMQIGDCMISPRSSVQGLAPENMCRQPETRIPSWSVEEKKPVDGCTATKNPRNHFDDDDIPEWCPPDFKRMRTEVDEKPGPSFGSSNSMVSRFSFTDMATGRQLPSPPPLPPLPPPRAVAQVQLLGKDHHTDSQLSMPPPLSQLPPPAVAQMQLLDKNYHTEHQRSLPPPLPPLPPPLVTQMQILDKNHPFEHQRSLPPPLPPVPPPPPAVAQVQFLDKNHPTEHHHSLPPPLPPVPPRPAVAQVQFLDKSHPIECQRSQPPPLPPHPPTRAVAQVELLDKSYPAEHQHSWPPLPSLPPPAIAQMELLDKNHPTEHQRSRRAQLPPPPPPAVAQVELLDEYHHTEHQRSLPPLPTSRPPTQGQVFDDKYSPAPHLPKPAVDALMRGYSDANEPSTRDSSPAEQPHNRYQAKRYQTSPPLPQTPPPPLNRPHYSKNNRPASRFSKRAVDDFTHDRPVAQSSHARSQHRRSSPGRYSPGRRLPPLVPEKSSANNYRHKRPADISNQKQFRHNDNYGPRARPPAHKHETGGSRNELPPSPPRSHRNSAVRRQFNRHGNHYDRSNWRSSRS
ncbi:hypothetical protein vseg_016451 [Gypsophila vaccaria]